MITNTFSFRKIAGSSGRQIVLPVVALLLSVLILQPATGQRKSSSGTDSIKIPFESYKLPNGLTVILSVDQIDADGGR